jgi:hypothetical protein
MKLGTSAEDQRIKQTFARFGLDPGNPDDWKKLVTALLPSQTWDKRAWAVLLFNYAELRTEMSFKEALYRLTQMYHGYEQESIKRELMNAFKEHNIARTSKKERSEAMKKFCLQFWDEL